MSIAKTLSLIIALFGVISTNSIAQAGSVKLDTLNKIIALSPELRPSEPPSKDSGLLYYRTATGDSAGYIDPELVDYGWLRDGSDLLIIPLISGTSTETVAIVVYTRIHNKSHYAGMISAPFGHLRAFIEHGRLTVETPIYIKGDQICCPSRAKLVHYDLVGEKISAAN